MNKINCNKKNNFYKFLPIYLSSLLIYAVISVLYFGLGVINHINTVYAGNGPDPTAAIWILSWGQYCLQHVTNPFFSDYIWAPQGYNVAQSIPMLPIVLLSLPLIHFFGYVGAFNLLTIFASS